MYHTNEEFKFRQSDSSDSDFSSTDEESSDSPDSRHVNFSTNAIKGKSSSTSNTSETSKTEKKKEKSKTIKGKEKKGDNKKEKSKPVDKKSSKKENIKLPNKERKESIKKENVESSKIEAIDVSNKGKKVVLKTDNRDSSKNKTKPDKGKASKTSKKESNIEVVVTSDEDDDEKEAKASSAPTTDITDVIDETNTEILAFLNDMYHVEGFESGIDEILENDFTNDDHCNKYEPVCMTKPRKCCCDCHKIEVRECHRNHHRVKEIKAPNGTNITIPIYAAAAGPQPPPAFVYQNPPTRLVWPPNNPPYCQNRTLCSSVPRHSNWNHSENNCQQEQPRYDGSNSRPFYGNYQPEVTNFNNQNIANSKSLHKQPKNYSDTEFEIESDFHDDHYSKIRHNDDIYDAFNNNRLNKVGSPMNWDEIFKFLD